jgi:hypothetical protein
VHSSPLYIDLPVMVVLKSQDCRNGPLITRSGPSGRPAAVELLLAELETISEVRPEPAVAAGKIGEMPTSIEQRIAGLLLNNAHALSASANHRRRGSTDSPA